VYSKHKITTQKDLYQLAQGEFKGSGQYLPKSAQRVCPMEDQCVSDVGQAWTEPLNHEYKSKTGCTSTSRK
jgi:hypothetical protein